MYGNLGGMGNLAVPKADTRALAKTITQDFDLGVLWALTENGEPGTPRRMFFDLDIKFANKAQVAEAENALPIVAREIYEQTKKFWGGLFPTGPGSALRPGAGAGAGAGLLDAASLSPWDGGPPPPWDSDAALPGFGMQPPFAMSQSQSQTQLPLSQASATAAGATAGPRSGTACLFDEGSQSQFERAAAGPLTGSGGLFTALILASGVRPAAPPLYGTAGVHVVFPKLYVTVDQALYISAAVIARLNTLKVPGGMGKGWEDRLDRAVYAERRGLRWAWQVKATRCSACGGTGLAAGANAGAGAGAGAGSGGGPGPSSAVAPSGPSGPVGCRTCRRTGQVPDRAASWYTPRARIVDGELADVAALCSVTRPTVDLLVEASIRGTEDVVTPTVGWQLYEGHPPLPLLKTSASGDAIRVYDDAGVASVRAPKDATRDLQPGDARVTVLEEAVRRMHVHYRALSVSRVIVHAGTGLAKCPRFRVYVTGVGATYCQNKGACHTSNSIKFWGTREGLQQECHSPHLHNGVLCSTFKSTPVQPFTTEERRVLFPMLTPATGSGGVGGHVTSGGVGGSSAGAGHGKHAGDSDTVSVAAAAAAAGLHAEAPVTGAMWAGMALDPAELGNARATHTPREQQMACLKTVRDLAEAARRRAAALRAAQQQQL